MTRIYLSFRPRKIMIGCLPLTFLCLPRCSCHAQTMEKVVVWKTNHDNIYNDYARHDSTTLFYLKLVPRVKPRGTLVIIPAGGDLVEDVIKQITLHQLAADTGFLVIIPSINDGSIKLDKQCAFLDTIFHQIIQQYGVPKEKFVLGGLSGGGMITLRYTEKANMPRHATVVRPAAIFVIDPPVDYINLYYAEQRDMERNAAPAAASEARQYLMLCQKEFGGTPRQVPGEYIRYSLYTHNDINGGNARFLKNTPLLIYTEPGIEWQLKNRHRDLYDLNCTDLSAMTNYLQTHGNPNVRMVVTHDKGIRLNGEKHPHSWSIMDNQECMSWILQALHLDSSNP